ncbi:MAG: hypothetical protein M0Z77_08145 [Thermoplasmatales archaeon]|jgi:hypothetical protein|nr:hypothetical protein [Thermoplasmatales archaeon]
MNGDPYLAKEMAGDTIEINVGKRMDKLLLPANIKNNKSATIVPVNRIDPIILLNLFGNWIHL